MTEVGISYEGGEDFRRYILENWALLNTTYAALLKGIIERRVEYDIQSYFKSMIISLYVAFFKYKDKGGDLAALDSFIANPSRLSLSVAAGCMVKMGAIMDNLGILEVSSARAKM